jgi:hypothetical protein
MSAALLPVYLTAAGLLAVSGIAKLRSPGPATDALVELRIPVSRLLVRVVALVELAAAALMVARPSSGAPIGSGLYLGFATLVLTQLVRGSARSCGCLGSAALSPTRLHVALNIALAGCCVLPHGDTLVAFSDGLVGVVIFAGAAVTAWALAAGLELLPQTLRSYQKGAA